MKIHTIVSKMHTIVLKVYTIKTIVNDISPIVLTQIFLLVVAINKKKRLMNLELNSCG